MAKLEMDLQYERNRFNLYQKYCSPYLVKLKMFQRFKRPGAGELCRLLCIIVKYKWFGVKLCMDHPASGRALVVHLRNPSWSLGKIYSMAMLIETHSCRYNFYSEFFCRRCIRIGDSMCTCV